MNPQTILTPEEVAEILKIAKNTVYELIKRGELTAYKVGNKVRVDLSDLETFVAQSKGATSRNMQPITTAAISGDEQVAAPSAAPNFSVPLNSRQANTSAQLILCGQDAALDILANTLQHHPMGVPVLRSFIGSYSGLTALYYDQCHMTAAHLWDGDRNAYNLSYVKSLVPGIPCTIIHLAKRIQGFYVAKGNPKNINHWSDLSRSDVVMINREKGSGTRVLLDEHLRLCGVDSRKIQGYQNEETSHLSIASAIARGKADVGMGCAQSAGRVQNIDFIPMQTENYELVIKKTNLHDPIYQLVYETIRSNTFKEELEGLGGYDLSDIGVIVGET